MKFGAVSHSATPNNKDIIKKFLNKNLFNFFICSKASNPYYLVVKWPGGHKSVYHCLKSPHHQPPPIASKR
jgi:hypothetical protein